MHAAWMTRPLGRLLCASALAVPLLWAAGCEDDDTADRADSGASQPLDCGELAFCGPLPEAPEGVEQFAQEGDAFPLLAGLRWRYRLRTEAWQSPPPVTEGAQITLSQGADADTFVREITTVIEVPEGADPQGPKVKVNQRTRETLLRELLDRGQGYRVRMAAVEITEHAVSNGHMVRNLKRTWDPPYVFIEDTQGVELYLGRPKQAALLVQDLQLAGDEAPEQRRGNVEVSVQSSGAGLIETMEGRYRESVTRIEISDDFTGATSRSLWFEPGVGVIRWQSRESAQLDFTLVDSHMEPSEAPEE